MYSNVVLDIDHHQFEEILEHYKERKASRSTPTSRPATGRQVIASYKDKVKEKSGKPFPQDRQGSALGRDRRRLRLVDEPARGDLPSPAEFHPGLGHGGQRAVDGVRQHGRDVGDRRRLHPQSLDRRAELYGEFLINAQGEDVVAGIRTPQNITEAARIEASSEKPSMETALPAVFEEFKRTTALLERHYRDMQDMEFTVEDGKLWMLQTRSGKRTAKASFRIAVDMANEGLITPRRRRCSASTR